jgi:DNA-binding NarL/FixJ family response regulator
VYLEEAGAVRIRLVVVDDAPTVRRGLRMHLECAPDLLVVAEAGDGALAPAVAVAGDVIVMDTEMPGVDGLAGIARLRALGCRVPVVLIDPTADEVLRARARAAGADALVSRADPAGALIDAIRGVATGAAMPAGEAR